MHSARVPLLSDSGSINDNEEKTEIIISSLTGEEQKQEPVTRLFPDTLLHLTLDYCDVDAGVQFAACSSDGWKKTLLTYCGDNEENLGKLLATASFKKYAADFLPALDTLMESEAKRWTQNRSNKMNGLVFCLWLLGEVATFAQPVWLAANEPEGNGADHDKMQVFIMAGLVGFMYTLAACCMRYVLDKKYDIDDVLDSPFSNLAVTQNATLHTANILKQLGWNTKTARQVVEEIKDIKNSSNTAAIVLNDPTAEAPVEEKKSSAIMKKGSRIHCHFYRADKKNEPAPKNTTRQKRQYCSVM